ncbi:MAG: undecaprenyl/decaprenyl-phosphate alpha-N-acetylglucosaminyl 1-phosphate transferase [Candidatus Nanopelagicales bacterium]|nr:undecaprenyl/decaprenyl-phosphate alpha-N-acetylglucosaminyl 1-phosphate transferase [Candidatus Nanopelagicales bacterium]MCU0295441.1 undecaprenyl/decaprenyl-phosphate alpha-N-acetylglucosaminyl 1-phosphate transferase [Candidatus Nanopelagicales bacterium]MCU0297660.1 undecaprenyl/decaprenyl-phosphate alpha-N-acetylglucosaminyl 1-phosphate transferase [Candidatus Nanopelagicales bacterium]
MREYLLCFLVAVAVTYLLTPAVRRLAIKAKAMAEVRDRDIHATPTPRWGGLAMYGGFLAGMLIASQLPQLRVVFSGNRQALALVVGATLIVGLGLLDDRFGLDAPTKFAGQVLAAGSMAFLGIQMVWLPIGGTLVLDPLTSVLLTVLFVVLTINAINFVDGLDGLAAGIVAIAAAAFFVYAFLLSVEFGFDRATLAALICALLAGICIGFLPHNLNPAKLFMGDTGSMLIGLLLAASAITLSGRVDPSAVRGELLLPAVLPLLLPLAVIAIPLIDVAMAIVRRTRRGRSPFAPDKEHLHHRLIELGHSQRRAVSLMHAWTALIAFSAVAVALIPWPMALVIFLVGLAGLAFLVSRPGTAAPSN